MRFVSFCLSRLGGDISDANQIKKHPFFIDVIWEDVLNKKVFVLRCVIRYSLMADYVDVI